MARTTECSLGSVLQSYKRTSLLELWDCTQDKKMYLQVLDTECQPWGKCWSAQCSCRCLGVVMINSSAPYCLLKNTLRLWESFAVFLLPKVKYVYWSFVNRRAEENWDERLEQSIGIKDLELENWNQEKRIKKSMTLRSYIWVFFLQINKKIS